MTHNLDDEADLLFRMLKDRYGDRLTAEQLEKVREELDGSLGNSEVLRATKLDNGVPPTTGFLPAHDG